MRYIRQYSNLVQPVSTTATSTLRWPFSAFQNQLSSGHLHLAALLFRFKGLSLDYANSGHATWLGRDRGMLIPSVTVAKDAQTKIINAVDGNLLAYREYAKAGGVLPEKMPDDLTATGMSGHDASWDYVVSFDEPDAIDPVDGGVQPLVAYRTSGYAEIQVALPTTIMSDLTYHSGATPTCELILLCTRKDNPVIAGDVRIEQVVDTVNVAATNARNGLIVPQSGVGIIRRLLALPQEIAATNLIAAPNAARYATIESPNQPTRFPFGRTMTADDYNRDFIRSSAIQSTDDANNVIVGNKVAVLISPAANLGQSSESALVLNTDLQLNLTVGATGIAAHRFLVERFYPRSASSAAQIAAASGIPDPVKVPQPGDGRMTNPKKAWRKQLIPVEIKSRSGG